MKETRNHLKQMSFMIRTKLILFLILLMAVPGISVSFVSAQTALSKSLETEKIRIRKPVFPETWYAHPKSVEPKTLGPTVQIRPVNRSLPDKDPLADSIQQRNNKIEINGEAESLETVSPAEQQGSSITSGSKISDQPTDNQSPEPESQAPYIQSLTSANSGLSDNNASGFSGSTTSGNRSLPAASGASGGSIGGGGVSSGGSLSGSASASFGASESSYKGRDDDEDDDRNKGKGNDRDDDDDDDRDKGKGNDRDDDDDDRDSGKGNGNDRDDDDSGSGGNSGIDWSRNVQLKDSVMVSVGEGATLDIEGNVNLKKNQLKIGGAGNTDVTGKFVGKGDIQKAGSGIMTLYGKSTYQRDLVISDGTLLLGRSNRLSDKVNVIMDGGSFNTGGFSERVGELTLTKDSVIDLGEGESTLNFADSSGSHWVPNEAVEIRNWSGSATGGGRDQLYFGSSGAGLTSDQLGQIQFFDPFGENSGRFPARILPTGEIVPAPEPSTILAALGVLGWIGFREKRRLLGWIQKFRQPQSDS